MSIKVWAQSAEYLVLSTSTTTSSSTSSASSSGSSSSRSSKIRNFMNQKHKTKTSKLRMKKKQNPNTKTEIKHMFSEWELRRYFIDFGLGNLGHIVLNFQALARAWEIKDHISLILAWET